jgi:hypothetical protein
MVDHNGIVMMSVLVGDIGVDTKNWIKAWKIVLNNMTHMYSAA